MGLTGFQNRRRLAERASEAKIEPVETQQPPERDEKSTGEPKAAKGRRGKGGGS